MTKRWRVYSAQRPLGRKRARYEMTTRYQGLPGYLPAERVQRHLIELTSRKLPMASIARDAGLDENAVRKIHNGAWETVRVRVADALLRVDFHPNERQGRVLAVGAVRRLRGLHAIAWSWPSLASRCELSAAQIQVIARRAPDTIPWRQWQTIDALYEQLSGTAGPDNRARLHAARQGWNVPLDWEYLDIDDPRVQPYVEKAGSAARRQIVADERAAEVRRLTAAGMTADQISTQLRLSARTVVRLRSRGLTTRQ